MHDYLSVADMAPDELAELLDVADGLKAERAERLASAGTMVRDDLRDRTVALVFEKPSTRTRVSFQVAVHELGGHPLPLSAAELQLGRGETIADTGAVLSRYVHGVVVRTFGQDRLVALATAADVPVINALTDLEHPCQALADLQTIRAELGALRGVTLAYVGDGNNVANSLLLAGALTGMHVRVAHPEGHAPDDGIVARARALAGPGGADLVVTTNPVEAVKGADVVYTDVWTSMGQEAQASDRITTFASYQVTAELMGQAGGDAIFLHCLPAHRGEEVATEVIDGPASRVFDQAENRLHAQKGLLLRLLAAEKGV